MMAKYIPDEPTRDKSKGAYSTAASKPSTSLNKMACCPNRDTSKLSCATLPKSQQKELSKLLRFLKDDIELGGQAVSAPPSWIFSQLLIQSGVTRYNTHHWLHDITCILSIIEEKLAEEKQQRFAFIDPETNETIWSAQDYTVEDALLYVRCIKQHTLKIEKELSWKP